MFVLPWIRLYLLFTCCRRGEEFQLCSDINSVGKYVNDITKLQKNVNELRERTILISEVSYVYMKCECCIEEPVNKLLRPLCTDLYQT